MPVVSGVYAAAVTPWREGPEIDLGAAFDLVDFLARGGVDGVALLTATGEYPHFGLEDRSRLISLAVKRSRVAVLAGVSHSTFDGALLAAREAASAGAAGILLAPPHFFPHSAAEVREFFLRFAERFADAAPVLLADTPGFTAPIGRDAAGELLATGRFAGIVAADGDWERLLEKRAGGPFALAVSDDTDAFRALEAGADAMVSAAAGAVPELAVALAHAARSGAEARVAQLAACWREFTRRAAEFPEPVAVRHAVTLRGLRTGGQALPPSPELSARLAAFAEWFQGWWPGVEKECAGA